MTSIDLEPWSRSYSLYPSLLFQQSKQSSIEVKETPAEEMKGVDHEEVVQTAEEEAKGSPGSRSGSGSAPEDKGSSFESALVGLSFLKDKEDASEASPDYSHTSVLKHLLHRYTGRENGPEDDDNEDEDAPPPPVV